MTRGEDRLPARLVYLDEVLRRVDRYARCVTPALLLVVYALAVARVAVLITEDRITQAPRDALLRRINARVVARCLRGAHREWDDAMDGLRMPASSEAEFRTLCKRNTAEHPPYLAYLLTCQWCIGFWLSAVAAPLWYWQGDNPWLLIPAVALAFSYATGKLSQFGG